jgi:hypothetical protein
VGVVPEGTSLVWDLEVVQERVSWCDRALGDANRTIIVARSCLEEAMPVLEKHMY